MASRRASSRASASTAAAWYRPASPTAGRSTSVRSQWPTSPTRRACSSSATRPGHRRMPPARLSMGSPETPGSVQQTGNPLDLGIHGQRSFAVQDADGKEAYTRAGDLHVDPTGQLLTATGLPVLGDNGPISIPPSTSITVGSDGTISIVPLGQSPQTAANVARIKLVNPPLDTVQRSSDGLF